MGQESEPTPAKSIHIDLENWHITLTDIDGRAIRFSPLEAWYHCLAKAQTSLPLEALTLAPVQEPELEPESPPAAETQPMGNPTTTISGKLKTQPKEGNPDRRGRPTAVARLAYHQDGQNEAQFYFCTFHGGTRPIALSLPIEAPITILGYPHPAPVEDEDRLDTFSVMRILKYPGQSAKRAIISNYVRDEA